MVIVIIMVTIVSLLVAIKSFYNVIIAWCDYEKIALFNIVNGLLFVAVFCYSFIFLKDNLRNLTGFKNLLG